MQFFAVLGDIKGRLVGLFDGNRIGMLRCSVVLDENKRRLGADPNSLTRRPCVARSPITQPAPWKYMMTGARSLTWSGRTMRKRSVRDFTFRSSTCTGLPAWLDCIPNKASRAWSGVRVYIAGPPSAASWSMKDWTVRSKTAIYISPIKSLRRSWATCFTKSTAKGRIFCGAISSGS
jgi:hypothetical protein